MFAKYFTKKRIVYSLVFIVVTLLLFLIFTKGIVNIASKDGYRVSYHTIDGALPRVADIKPGMQPFTAGHYIFTFAKGSDVYTKAVEIKPFFQYTSVSFETVTPKAAKHISANTRSYLHTFQNKMYTYDSSAGSLLQQDYNDPFANNNANISFLDGDGSCEIIGSLGSVILCASAGEEYAEYSSIYAIDIPQKKTDASRSVALQNANARYKLDDEFLVVLNDKKVRIYSSLTKDPVSKTLAAKPATSGRSPLATVQGDTLRYLTGVDFSDEIGDSDNQKDLTASYVAHTFNLTKNTEQTRTLTNYPLISSVDSNSKGDLLLKTINGFIVVDVSGKMKFQVVNDIVNSVFWLNDTTILYQTVDGIYGLDTRSWSSVPYFSHDNIAVSSASKTADGIYLAGFYKDQESQEQQGFIIDTNQKEGDKNLNKLYSFLPKETLDYIITPDQSSIYILPRTVSGSSGAAQEGTSHGETNARQYLQDTLPDDLKSIPIVVVR